MNCINIKIISFLFAMVIFPFSAFGAINVDGRLDEAEWKDAQSFSEFVIINPPNLNKSRLGTQAKIVSTPGGLAVAFICEQPEEKTRTRTVSTRDAASCDSDYVTFIADFDGTGEIGHEFRVTITGCYADGIIRSQDQHNFDWDGVWQRAVSEDKQNWTVEILIPWSIASMRSSEDATRRIGVSFQRVLYSSNQTVAFPGEIYDSQHTVSNSAKISVANYSSQKFDFRPYASVLSDMVKHTLTGKAGADLFWKPSGSFQVLATVNPDFGQVESDQLVINFTAFETYFSDKRPFFTENQSIFDTSKGLPGRLVYTRRVGAESDDHNGPGSIQSAVKIIGSADSLKYGFFTAMESGDAGRNFYAGRLLLPKENWKVGLLSTYTERPFLNRTALVNAIDYSFNFGDSVVWLGQFTRSTIETQIKDKSGFGAWSGFHYTPSKERAYMLYLNHYDKKFDINDMGFLRRNNYQELMFRAVWNRTDFETDSSTSGVTWALMNNLSRNTDGDSLPWTFQLSRTQNMRNGAIISSNISYQTKGYDDLFSRGNGTIRLNRRWSGSASYTTQRIGAWRESVGAQVLQEGINGWAFDLNGSATWYPNDSLNLALNLDSIWSRDWLNWVRSTQIGDYSRQQVTGKLSGNWFPAEKHEFRLLAQWVTVNADAIQSYHIGNGRGLASDNILISDFAAINFGLQLRYRYELAPLSYLYFVYSRGGLDFINDPDRSTLGLLSKSTSLRNSDQAMVKIQYRF